MFDHTKRVSRSTSVETAVFRTHRADVQVADYLIAFGCELFYAVSKIMIAIS